jgi:hypothetical protein
MKIFCSNQKRKKEVFLFLFFQVKKGKYQKGDYKVKMFRTPINFMASPRTLLETLPAYKSNQSLHAAYYAAPNGNHC